jgi:hypothetical protein
MSTDMSTDPPFRRLTDLRCRSCGYSISAYADLPTRCPMCSAERSWVNPSRPYTARAERRDTRNSRPGSLAIDVAHTPVIMAGSVWIVAAVIVLYVTAAVYLAVRLGS